MKKMNCLLLVLSIMLMLPLHGIAGSAGPAAIIPYFSAVDNTPSGALVISISNITDSDIDVIVTLYDQNGNVITDGDDSATSGILQANNVIGFYDTGQSGGIGPDESAVLFIAANATAELILMPTSVKYGYGTIQWIKADARAVCGLVAQAFPVRLSDTGDYERYTLLINGGNPF